MILPDTGKRKALFIIDVQPRTFAGPVAPSVAERIVRFVEKVPYDAYVVAEYHAPEHSMFFRQGQHTLSREDTGETHRDIISVLHNSNAPLFNEHKIVRSCFKGEDSPGLKAFLTAQGIEEIHLAGFDINDCVLGSAYDSIDSDYFTFVLEELSGHAKSNQDLTEAALIVLRWQNMTNNSLPEDIGRKTIDV